MLSSKIDFDSSDFVQSLRALPRFLLHSHTPLYWCLRNVTFAERSILPFPFSTCAGGTFELQSQSRSVLISRTMGCLATTSSRIRAGPRTGVAAAFKLSAQGTGGSQTAGTGTRNRSAVRGNGEIMLRLDRLRLRCRSLRNCTGFLPFPQWQNHHEALRTPRDRPC